MYKKNKFVFFRTIKGKLLFWILLYVLSFFCIILYLFFDISKNHIEDAIINKARYQTNVAAEKLNSIIKSLSDIPDEISSIFSNVHFNENQIDSLQKSVLQNQYVFGCCVAYKPQIKNKDTLLKANYFFKQKNTIYYKNLGNKNYNYPLQNWYKYTSNSLKSNWSEPYFDKDGGEIKMITYSAPFYKQKDGKQNFEGVVTIDIDLFMFETLCKTIQVLENNSIFIVSEKGNFIYHSFVLFNTLKDFSSISSTLACDSTAVKKLQFNMINQNQQGFCRLDHLYSQNDYWTFYSPIKSAKWSIGILFSDNELYADLHKTVLWIISFFLIGMTILFLIIFFTIKKITKFIQQLAQITSKIGKGNFNIEIPQINSHDEIELFRNSLSYMTLELKKYIENIVSLTSAKERIESELKIAQSIQLGMLPKSLNHTLLNNKIKLEEYIKPALVIGGDFYDFFMIDEQYLVFSIGDVCGKSVYAALLMTTTVTLLRSQHSSETIQIITNLNKQLCVNNKDMMFVTCFIGIINLKTFDFEYTNAGHNYPYYYSNSNGLVALKGRHGVSLGLQPNTVYKSEKLKLSRHDKLILYTDGITEAMNNDDEFYSDKKFQQIIENHVLQSPKKLIETILTDLNEHVKDAPQSDDITLLIIEVV